MDNERSNGVPAFDTGFETADKRVTEPTSFGIQWWAFPALAPFVYVLIGLLFGDPWWAFGWMIIPVSGILFAAAKR